LQHIIEIDAGVVVEGAAADGGHLLLAGDHKLTGSIENVLDIEGLPNRIKYVWQ